MIVAARPEEGRDRPRSRRDEPADNWLAPRDSGCLTPDEILAICEGRVQLGVNGRVDRHLDECSDCVRLLSEASHDFEPARVPERVLGPLLFEPGMKIGGRYRVTDFVGRGGMGEVYEARDGMTGERVALKTVASTLCDNPRAMQRLAREVQLAQCIVHPNVCLVRGLGEHRYEGEDSSAVYFLTMEYIEGETLRSRLLSARLPLEQALGYAREVLEGLAALHAAGIVHRDLKPDNIMLRQGRNQQHAVIMDFGLAHDVDTAEGCTSARDRLSGTAAYMAPEQVTGGEPIRPTADIYCFGVVLFEVLTHRLPFTGDSRRAIAAKRLTDESPRPSSIVPGLPAQLDDFVVKCLARGSVDRFVDARAALLAFDRSVPPPCDARK
jgi:serine/threonine protein kinase